MRIAAARTPGHCRYAEALLEHVHVAGPFDACDDRIAARDSFGARREIFAIGSEREMAEPGIHRMGKLTSGIAGKIAGEAATKPWNQAKNSRSTSSRVSPGINLPVEFDTASFGNGDWLGEAPWLRKYLGDLIRGRDRHRPHTYRESARVATVARQSAARGIEIEIRFPVAHSGREGSKTGDIK